MRFEAYLTRFASFSSCFMADTSAAARSVGLAVTSHILFDFKGPFLQSGPTAPNATGTRGAIANQLASEKATILSYEVNWEAQMLTFCDGLLSLYLPSPALSVRLGTQN